MGARPARPETGPLGFPHLVPVSHLHNLSRSCRRRSSRRIPTPVAAMVRSPSPHLLPRACYILVAAMDLASPLLTPALRRRLLAFGSRWSTQGSRTTPPSVRSAALDFRVDLYSAAFLILSCSLWCIAAAKAMGRDLRVHFKVRAPFLSPVSRDLMICLCYCFAVFGCSLFVLQISVPPLVFM